MGGKHVQVPCSFCGVQTVRRGRLRCWKCAGFEEGTPQERLERKVQVMPNGCWEWQGNTDNHGYGEIRGLGQRRAHRLSWVIHRGPIPEGMDLLHHCDNPPCVNPEHLFPGTQGDNNRDRSLKGRSARGERSPHAKITEAQAVEVLLSDKPSKILAAELGVHVTQINKIRRGAKWAHLQEVAA